MKIEYFNRCTFEDENELRIWMHRKRFNKIDETINHETAHFKKATDLGYTPFFVTERNMDEPDSQEYWDIFVETKEQINNREHKVAILLAPENPSSTDKFFAKVFGERSILTNEN